MSECGDGVRVGSEECDDNNTVGGDGCDSLCRIEVGFACTSCITGGSGVGGVVIFLPQIVILFTFLHLLQDVGYMARAAFVIDRVMGWAGLQGRSFVPLLSCFACAIPGMMAARPIASPRARLATILVAPFKSDALVEARASFSKNHHL